MDPQEQLRAARKQHMESDYLPVYPGGAVPAAADRLANAADFAAFQLGQINRTLQQILRAMEQKT